MGPEAEASQTAHLGSLTLGRKQEEVAAVKQSEPSMLEATLLSLEERTETQIREIAQADILVGIPSFNNSSTIGHVVKAVIAGLAKYFPEYRAVLVNSDGGSTDGTPDVVAKASVDLGVMLMTDRQSVLHRIITPYKCMTGKGSACRTILDVARRLGVKGCEVMEADVAGFGIDIWITTDAVALGLRVC